MEPREVLPDWLERMASLLADALGYEVYAIDGVHLGTVVEVVRPPMALRPEQLVIARGRRSKTSAVSLSLIRAVDPARRLVILTLGAAAFHELGSRLRQSRLPRKPYWRMR
jgi:PRC-barrel domain